MNRLENAWNSVFTTNHAQMFLFFSFFWVMFYFSIYMFWSLHRKYKIECMADAVVRKKISIRVTSTIHAVSVTILAILTLITDSKLHRNKVLYNTPEISFTLNLVIGYMAYDLITMLAYKELYEFESIIHHIVSAIAFYACTNHGVFTFIALARLTSEASTLFINIRWLLLTFKMKYSKLYVYNGFLIAIFFGLFRICPIIPIWYQFYLSTFVKEYELMSLGFKFICVFSSLPLDCLNVYWFYLIINSMRRYTKVDVNNNNINNHTDNKVN